MDNKYKFAVVLPSKTQDPNGFYKRGIVDILKNKYPHLTVAGLDNPDVKRGIQYAGPGNLLTFGTAKNHDVNWVERPDYAREKGYSPVYDLIKDWNTVTAKIDMFAREKRRLQELEARNRYASYNSYYGPVTIDLGNNVKVQVFDSFIKVGTTIIPRVAKAETFKSYTVTEVRAIESIIVTLKRLY